MVESPFTIESGLHLLDAGGCPANPLSVLSLFVSCVFFVRRMRDRGMWGGEAQRGVRTWFLARKRGKRPETEGLLALEFVRFHNVFKSRSI